MKNNTPLIKTLIALDSAIAVSGDEREAIDIFHKEMDGLYDEHFSDPLDNQFYIKHGKNPSKKVLLAAHLDEIGFIINHIDENGFGRILPVGFHDDRMVVNQDLAFITAKGLRVYGVTGSKPAHIMSEQEHNAVVKIEDLFVDFGTESAQETRDLGLEIGDYGTFARTGKFLNGTDCYCGKSIDDRAGAALLVELLRRLKGIQIEPTIAVVGTTQEEVGMRSGGIVCNRFNPELALAIDVTITGGVPGIEYRQANSRIGGGVCFKFYDWDKKLICGNNVSRKVTDRMIRIAQKYNIAFQREVFIGGGTDAWSASLSGLGVRAGGISIPMRYAHTAVGTVKISDLEICADFLLKFLKDYESL